MEYKDRTLNEVVKEEMKRLDYRYFVIKVDDLCDALTENELIKFSEMLDKFNEFRKPKPANSYFLINRDEYDINSVDEFLSELSHRKKQ